MPDATKKAILSGGLISYHTIDAPITSNLNYGFTQSDAKSTQAKTVITSIDGRTELLIVNETSVGQPLIMLPTTSKYSFKFRMAWDDTKESLENIDIVFCSTAKITNDSSIATTKNDVTTAYILPESIVVDVFYLESGTEKLVSLTKTITSADVKANFSERANESVIQIVLTDIRPQLAQKKHSGMYITFAFPATSNNGITDITLQKICPIAAIIPVVKKAYQESQGIAPPPLYRANLAPGDIVDTMTRIIPVETETNEVSMSVIYSSIDSVVDTSYSYENLFDRKLNRPILPNLQITEYGYGYAWQPVGSNRDDFWTTKVETNNPHNDKSIHILAVADKPFVVDNVQMINGFPRASLRQLYKEAKTVRVRFHYVKTGSGQTTFTQDEQTKINTLITNLKALSSFSGTIAERWTQFTTIKNNHLTNIGQATHLALQECTSLSSVNLDDRRPAAEFINPQSGIPGQKCHVDAGTAQLFVSAGDAIKKNNDMDKDAKTNPCVLDTIVTNNDIKTFLNTNANAAIIAVEFLIDAIREPKNNIVEYERLATPSIAATSVSAYEFKFYTPYQVTFDDKEYIKAGYCDGNSWSVVDTLYLRKASFLSITEFIVSGKLAYKE